MDRTGNRHCMASVYKIFWYSLSLRKASPPTAGTCCVVLVFVGGLCDEAQYSHMVKVSVYSRRKRNDIPN